MAKAGPPDAAADAPKNDDQKDDDQKPAKSSTTGDEGVTKPPQGGTGAGSSQPPEDDPPQDPGMTFWEHLEELRSRLFKMAVAATIGGGLAWWKHVEILNWLLAPFQRGWSQHFDTPPAIHFPNPAGLFVAYLKISLIGGLILALPFIFYQLWAFIAPGLYSREKRFAIPFVVASTSLFCGGVFFAMKVAFPAAFAFLLGMVQNDPGSVEVKPTIMVDEYVSFVTQMLLAFGAVFELPVVAFFLSVAGIIDHTHLIKFFRYFVVIAFLLGALLTPPDMLSQFFMAIPLIVLYGISIVVAWIFARSKKK
jgi:sec-independent protein translocase protein TatC